MVEAALKVAMFEHCAHVAATLRERHGVWALSLRSIPKCLVQEAACPDVSLAELPLGNEGISKQPGIAHASVCFLISAGPSSDERARAEEATITLEPTRSLVQSISLPSCAWPKSFVR